MRQRSPLRRPAARLAAALALGALAPAAAPAQTESPEPLPGRWEYNYRILLIPVGTEYWCLKPQEVRRAFEGPCNRHHTCTYPVHEVGGGKMRLQGRWVDKRGRVAPVRGEGTYDSTSIRLNFSGRSIHGLPFRGAVTARRISDTCEPGDK
jgi:hypothetical protein